MKKRIISTLLCLVLLLSAAPTAMAAPAETQESNIIVTPATVAQDGTMPRGGSSPNSQNYTTYAAPVKSVLAKEGAGYTLVTGHNGGLNVEQYDESFRLLSQKSIDLPLPIYGGVYICDDYNFVVCAQNNKEEDNSKEVYRVIRYTKNWDNPVHCGLYGANTTAAVDAGSLRFARYGDTILIRTCHEMYRSSDGLCHQANLTMAVSASQMRITDALYGVSNIKHGYVSHSFNQFIQMDGGTIVAADHGDAIPRSVVISRYNDFAVSGRSSYVEAFPIAQNTGHYNTTGVSVGGFEVSDSHYILAGNSCPQTGGINQGSATRNIFVTSTSKSLFSAGGTTTTFITNYTDEDNVSVTTPHLVKIDNNNFLLMWSVKGKSEIHMCFLNGQGYRYSDITTVEGYLSDCAPIYVDGDVLWVTYSDGVPNLYRLSIKHEYILSEKAPDCVNDGYKYYKCTHCVKSFTVTLPALGHDCEESKDQPICTEPGTASYVCKTCGYTYSEVLEAKEHLYRFSETVAPDCVTEGCKLYACVVCGHQMKDDIIEPTGHTYESYSTEPSCAKPGKSCLLCSSCGDETDVEIIPALEHEKKLYKTDPGTCISQSRTEYRCVNCGQSFTDFGETGDHDFIVYDSEVPGCTEPGYEFSRCKHCGEEKQEELEPTNHDYYLYTWYPASCTYPGSETKVCLDCGHRITVETPKTSHEFFNNSCLWCGQLAAYSETVSINYRRIKIVLNGEEIIPCDGAGATVEPFIMASNGTTYLPLRAVSQALGLNVSWDGVANTVDLSSGGVVKTGAGPAGSSMGLCWTQITYRQIRVFLNGEELELVNRDGNKVEPFILNQNSSVYLPLRIIGEALGLNVSWDGYTSTVYLDSIG